MTSAFLAFVLLGVPPEAPVPELPRLPLAQYPAELGARVSEALAGAKREPRSAAATGALGMLLHAYDQFESAEACYRRARALEPTAFEWAYLEGVVAGRLGRQEATVTA